MTVYAVMKCLRTWTIDPGEAGIARGCSASELAERYGLSEEEATAMVEGRVDLLNEMGVHPMSLVQLSRIFGFSITAKWEELQGAGSKGGGHG